MGLTLLFDIDGTLIRTQGAGLAAMEFVAKEQFGISQLQRVPVQGRTDTGIIQELFEVNRLELNDANRQLFFREYLKHLPNTLHQFEGTVLPNVGPVLERLGAHPDVKLGLLTGNLEAAAWIKLKHFELAKYFSFGGFGDQHGDRNLVAADAVRAAEIHGHRDGDAFVVIGDTPNDIRCGQHIGAINVAVLTGGYDRSALESASADLLLEDLADEDAFFETLGL